MFAKENVYIQNPDYVNQTIESMKKDGSNLLQVISDFDWTMTKYEDIAGKNYSSYG